MIPLLFFSCLKFRETSAEGSFAYYACCSKQGTLRNLSSACQKRTSLVTVCFVQGRAVLKGRSFLDSGISDGSIVGAPPEGSQGGWAWDSYHRSPQTGPSLCHSESLGSLLSGCIPFSSICLSPSTALEQLGISVYGRKFSWCET